MNRGSELSLRDVSRHRPVIYGFCALWIVLHHMISKVPSGVAFAPVRWLKYNGACGVEIFVILAAFGAYHSLKKDPDVRGFYKRRLQRVVPCAFIISAICYGLAGWVDLRSYLGAITFFPYWLGYDGLWYVPFVLTLYLFYPLIHRLQQRYAKALWGLLVLALAFSAWSCYVLVPGNGHWLMPIMRFPLFLLSCIFAPYAERGERIPLWVAPAALVGYLLIAYVCPRGTSDEFLRSVSYIPLSIFMGIALTWLARLFTRCCVGRGLYRFIALCGSVSLEIYLIYNRLLYFMTLYPAYADGRIGSIKLEMVTLLLTLILSLLLNRFCRWLVDRLSAIEVPREV